MRFSGLFELSAGLANACTDWYLIKKCNSEERVVCLRSLVRLGVREPQRKKSWRIFVSERTWENILVFVSLRKKRELQIQAYKRKTSRYSECTTNTAPSYYFLSLSSLLFVETQITQWITRGKYKIDVWVQLVTELRRNGLHVNQMFLFPLVCHIFPMSVRQEP